jgi:hypothetical protein
MSRILKSRRAKVVLGVVAALAITVAAVAYWTSSGSSTTTATTQAGNGTTFSFGTTNNTPSGLAPGAGVKELTGTVTNTDADTSYKLQTITATLSSVSGAGTADANHPACSIDDYRLSDISGGDWVITSSATHTNDVATLTVNSDLAASATHDFDKLGVAMFDASTNQDTCKGATLHISYAAA